MFKGNFHGFIFRGKSVGNCVSFPWISHEFPTISFLVGIPWETCGKDVNISWLFKSNPKLWVIRGKFVGNFPTDFLSWENPWVYAGFVVVFGSQENRLILPYGGWIVCM